ISQKRARPRWLTERIASMGPAHGDPIQRTKTQARVGPARCEKSCGKTVWKNKPDGNVIFWWTNALMADPFMEARGYRLYDVLPQYYRPRDGALYQMDVFYVRNDSALIASRSWD